MTVIVVNAGRSSPCCGAPEQREAGTKTWFCLACGKPVQQ